jgi:hypothetical protein
MLSSGLFGKNYKKLFKEIEYQSHEAQQKTLHHILKVNTHSGFGHIHDFKHIKTPDDFAKKVPLHTHEKLIAYLENEKRPDSVKRLTNAHIKWFAQTSGTTSSKKKIPVSKEFIKQNHYYVSKIALFNMIYNFGYGWLIGSKNLSMAGYSYDEKYKGKRVMDISALLQEELPVVYKIINFPNQTFENWDEKLKLLCESPRRLGRVSLISGVPTWVLSMFDKLETHYQQPITTILKNLRLFIHGGVNFQNYKKVFSEIFDDRDFAFFEAYNASEGFYAIQYQKNSSDLLLITNASIYYEFRPLDHSEALPLHKINVGEEYEMIISTPDGLYRYQTGDVVMFSSKNPYLLTIKGRTTEFINAFGEDMELKHVNTALLNMTKNFTFSIKDFFVVPHYQQKNTKGWHDWYIEFNEPPADINLFNHQLDEQMKLLNNNYHQKRYNNIALERLHLHLLKPGTFEMLLKKKGKVGGQIKIKKLHNNRDILTLLETTDIIENNT